MLPSNTNTLIHNGNPMLNVEQYKRYLALQTRLNGNSMLNVEEYSEYVQLHTQFQDSIVAQPTVSNELNNQRDVENNVESNVEAEIIVEKNVEPADNTIINADNTIINTESNNMDIIHYKSYSETNETNKRQTTYNLTNTPIDLIISKTAMLFITNFKSTNEVKQASKAVGSTAVETMVTEDAVGCVFESKDFGGIQIICDYGFNDVVQKAVRKVFTSTGVKSIPKEQIHLVKQLLIRKDVIGAKKGKASKEFNNMGMYNVAEYVGAIKSVLTDKTAVINAIHHWRKEKSETRRKKVLKTIRWFTGNKNDIKEVKTELNGMRWRNDALCAFNDNKQNRMFLQKVRAYLNAFIRVNGKVAGPDIPDIIFQSIAEYTKTTCEGQLGVEDITMATLKAAYQKSLETLFADNWSSASISNNTRKMEDALLALFFCFAIHQPWCKRGKVNGDAIRVLKEKRKEARKFTSSANRTYNHDVPILQQTRLYEDGGFVSELLKCLTIPGKEDLKDIFAEWKNGAEYIVPFDAEKRVNESQVTKDKAKFLANASKRETFTILGSMFKHCSTSMGVCNVDQMARFFFQNGKPGAKWMKVWAKSLALKYKVLTRAKLEEVAYDKQTNMDVDPEEEQLGHAIGYLDKVRMDVAISRLEKMKVGSSEWLSEFSCIFMLWLSIVFGIRDNMVFAMQVLSASDYEIVLSHAGRAGDWRKLLWGIFLIKTENGFRLVKTSSKTGKSKNEPDFDSQTAPQIVTKPYMKQMMEWLFIYFEAKHPNQYHVTHNSTNPEGYRAYDINDEDGWHPYLQLHTVRWSFPLNECGNKYLIGLNVPHTGRKMYVKAEWEHGFPEEANKKGYQANKKIGDKQQTFDNMIEHVEVEYKLDGSSIKKANLRAIKNVQPRQQFKTMYTDNKNVNRAIQKSLKRYKAILDKEIEQGTPSGTIGKFTTRVMNKALYASLLLMKGLTVNFTASGRHGKAEVFLQAMNIIKIQVGENPKDNFSHLAETRILDAKYKNILQFEAHMNERCVEKHYKALKKENYYKRVHLSNLNVEQTAKRLASHPDWCPDIDMTLDGQKCCVQLGGRPCTVVKPEGIFTKETFWNNCNNMYTLSINQQNHQLRWFQLFLEVIECMKVIENKVPNQSTDYLAFAKTIQEIVNRAKDIHRQNQKTIWNTEKGMGERVFNLMDDMGRSINQCVDDLQVSIGIKRGLSDNSDFDSSDEENESPTKKQRVESPAPN